MTSSLSKQRTRKARDREKQATKAATRQLPFLQRPVCGLATGFLLWGLTLLVLSIDTLLARSWDTAALLQILDDGFVLLIALAGVGLYLQIVNPKLLRRNNDLLMLALVSLVTIIGSQVWLHAVYRWAPSLHDSAPYLLPYALAPILATILLGDTAGLATGTWTSIVLAGMLGGQFTFLVCGLVTTILSAITIRRVRTRSKVVKRGLVIGLVQTVFVLSESAANWPQYDVAVVVNQAAACLFGGFASSVIALLIMPPFETGFKIASDISLLELSDVGHPVLRRLAIEAPGTYHHSLVVANLATAAADVIGANSLLARVGAYYHDIGKLTKPEFFAENQGRRGNPHDNLAPSMSTLVITSHVKEGLSLAMRHHLPPRVMAAIHEHHGTCLLSCFHHKARRQLEFELPDEDGGTVARIDDTDFRYPGPCPSTRETAIICLADAVEAASRSLEKVTPTHIENLVSDIVRTRVVDGQLDYCPMTFAELRQVQRSLVFSLASMLHGRVPYPSNERNGNEQTKPGRTQPAGDSAPDRIPDGASRPA